MYKNKRLLSINRKAIILWCIKNKTISFKKIKDKYLNNLNLLVFSLPIFDYSMLKFYFNYLKILYQLYKDFLNLVVCNKNVKFVFT